MIKTTLEIHSQTCWPKATFLLRTQVTIPALLCCAQQLIQPTLAFSKTKATCFCCDSCVCIERILFSFEGIFPGSEQLYKTKKNDFTFSFSTRIHFLRRLLMSAKYDRVVGIETFTTVSIQAVCVIKCAAHRTAYSQVIGLWIMLDETIQRN